MIDWLRTLQETLAIHTQVVLVTVIDVVGSVPREIGATLTVSAKNQSGTIGGGNLEFTAIEHARKILASKPSSSAVDVDCKRMSLGPSLGQCCGGRVELLYERVTIDTRWVNDLLVSQGDQQSVSNGVLHRCLDGTEAFVAELGAVNAYKFEPITTGAGISVSAVDGNRWFSMPLAANLPDIWVFGAGHVGQAVIAQLSLLPCRLTWLDHREDWLQHHSDLEVTRVLIDSPADEVGSAQPNTHFVVMTHSHAFDFDICHAVLESKQFAWLGLIGSATKRQTFATRLSRRGVDDDLIQKIRCPIGELPMQSSHPHSIALSLAAELAMLWQRDV